VGHDIFKKTSDVETDCTENLHFSENAKFRQLPRSFVKFRCLETEVSGGLQGTGKELFREYSLCDKFIKLRELQTLMFPSALVEFIHMDDLAC
jgi:hypothetical protein